MTSLPVIPNLTSLKKQAKKLLKSFKNGDQDSLELISQYFPRPENFKSLRDAQLVIARNYGYSGWTALKKFIESEQLKRMSPEQLANKFIDYACVAYGMGDSEGDFDKKYKRAERYLKQFPKLSEFNFITAIVSNNFEHVKHLLSINPELAITPYGKRDWPPMLYLTFSRITDTEPDKKALKIASLLLEHGASPDSCVDAPYGQLCALTGAMGEGEAGPVNQPPHQYAEELATLLLDAGANPNEGQGLYNTQFTESLDKFWLPQRISYGLNKDHILSWDKNEKTTTFNYMLEVAITRKNMNRVRFLIGHGADCNAHSWYADRNIYSNALVKGEREIADYLLAHGAITGDLSDMDEFLIAVAANDLDKLDSMLDAHPEFLDDPETFSHASLETIKLIIGKGFDLNKQNKNGSTLLHIAAGGEGKLEIVRHLLKKGADPYIRDHRFNGSALGHAHFNQNYEVRDFLLGQIEDTTEMSACGAYHRLHEVLEKRSDLAGYTSNAGTGNTPLHLVCNWLPAATDYTLKEKIIDLLLSKGADINARNKHGLTPLQAAEQWNEDDVWDILTSRGAT